MSKARPDRIDGGADCLSEDASAQVLDHFHGALKRELDDTLFGGNGALAMPFSRRQVEP